MAMGKTHVSVAHATALSVSYGWVWMHQDGWINNQHNWIQQVVKFVNDTTGFNVEWLQGYTLPILSSVPFIPDNILGAVSSLILLAIGVLIFGFCNLLPDIDSDSSILGRYVPTNFGGHRGVVHSLYPVILLMIPAIVWQHFVLWLIPLGYFTHLLVDDASVAGIHWLPGLAPPFRRYHMFRYQVNGPFEKMVLRGGSWFVSSVFIFLWVRRLFG